MRKLLKPQDILLLGIGGLIDIFEEVKDPLGIMAKSYESMYGFVPKKYKRHNYSHLVWRTLKTGYIEKIVKKGEVYLRLSGEGGEKVARDFPLLAFQKRKWDGKWRIVLFDIAELNRKVRDMLRRKLKELGFGMFQQSVYISPHNFTKDLLEFLNAAKLSDFVYVFEISHNQMAIGDQKQLANKLWRLDSINERYVKLIEKIRHLTDFNGRGIQLNGSGGEKDRKNKEYKKSREELLKDIREEYLNLIIVDPFLPRELLPSDWVLPKLTSMLRKL